MGPLGPFWTKWAHLSQFWPPIPPVPQMEKRTPRTTYCPLSTPGLWQSPEATKSSSARSPLHSGERLLFTNVLCTMDSGMVHIWYNISLSTSFAQQSNGDGFRTKLGHFKPSLQIQHPFQRKSFQSFSLAIHGGYQKTL
ncbi:hypothetical protein O181_037101 [Austropuccinia psidii MF-1]|uniref:Uncharacterized protein n=1 Tax=Austropuccinia psidii MF-1 TaxID=1389203 RepID=A0A9Q3D5K5_9BASI|nr:hypothetical protein [Austropuccinia psidii MF-1]